MPWHASAQTAVLRADPAQITVGDRARLFLEVKKPAQDTLQWPTIPQTFAQLEVAETGKIDTQQTGDVITYKQRLLVTGFDSGQFTILPFVFTFTPSGGGAPYVLQTDSLSLLVQTVAVDTTKPYMDIKGVMAVPKGSSFTAYRIMAAVAALLLIALLVWVLLRKKGKALPQAAQKPKETAHEKAWRLLQELEAQKLWQNERVKEYYIGLTNILRGYIEDRFATHALELTTDEILLKARVHKEMRPFYNQLAATLQTADLAKFAKAKPLPEEHMAALEQVQQFVLETKPKSQEATIHQ
jgi:hypothetical protein